MQFIPKTDKQISEEMMLPPGDYDFQVTSAEDKVSKSGNPMIMVDLDVFAADGTKRHVKDYLMEAMAFKLRHFCYAIGLGAAYEAGKLDATEIGGRGGRLKLGTEPAKDNYPAKNTVKDYLKPEARSDAAGSAAPAASRSAAAREPAIDDQTIPF